MENSEEAVMVLTGNSPLHASPQKSRRRVEHVNIVGEVNMQEVVNKGGEGEDESEVVSKPEGGESSPEMLRLSLKEGLSSA